MAAGLLALLKRLIKTPPLHSQHSFRNLVEGQLRAQFPCIFCGSETLIIITGRFHCANCGRATEHVSEPKSTAEPVSKARKKLSLPAWKAS
jgi:hypothetical protein